MDLLIILDFWIQTQMEQLMQQKLVLQLLNQTQQVLQFAQVLIK